jgi:DNA-binding NtrC family response regulator
MRNNIAHGPCGNCLLFMGWPFGPAVAKLRGMILLIWSSEKAAACAGALEQAFAQPVRVASNMEQACEEIKTAEFSAVLIDQWIDEMPSGKANLLFQRLGGAVPVTINFAISAMDRVVRTVRAALEQRDRESRMARQEAVGVLRAQLKDDVTALLLLCGLALQEPALTEMVAARIRTIEEVANQIRRKLSTDGGKPASVAAHA